MTLPDRNDFLDYAEGAPLKSADIQKNILLLLASSKIYREQCAELQRDLYHIDVKIPEYPVTPPMAVDLSILANDWVKLRLARSMSFRTFTRTREFVLLLVGIFGACVFILAMALWRLQ